MADPSDDGLIQQSFTPNASTEQYVRTSKTEENEPDEESAWCVVMEEEQEGELDISNVGDNDYAENARLYDRKQFLEGAISAQAFIYRMLKKRLENGHCNCKLCGAKISVHYGRGPSHQAADHARQHLGKPQFFCRICQNPFTTHNGASHHLSFKHRARSFHENMDDISKDTLEGLLDMIDRCYGDGDRANTVDQDIPVGEYCQRAMIDRMQNGKVQCLICNEKVKVGGLKQMNHPQAIEHAFKHLDKDVYICRLCGHGSRTITAMRAHSKRIHKRRAFREIIEDKTSEYHKELRATIDVCYGRPEGVVRSGFELPKESLEQLEKAKRKIIHQRGHDLIEKYSKKSKRLSCLLCEKSLLVTSSRNVVLTRFIIDHANEHLGMPLYECRYCKKSTTGLQPIMMHVKHCHAETSRDGYVDMSHEFHEETLRMLNECYDADKADNVAGDEEEYSEDQSTAENSNIGGKFKKREPDVKKCFMKPELRTSIKFTAKARALYRCCHCSMTSRNGTLMKMHVRLAHM